MRWVVSPGEAESTVKRSRFVARLEAARSLDAMQSRCRASCPGADHYVGAARIGGEEYTDDDGEPSGTAGAPILLALRQADVTDAALVVARYFGGTRLGRPGLWKAYHTVAVSAIAQAHLVEPERLVEATLRVDYRGYARLLDTLGRRPHVTTAVRFEDHVEWSGRLSVPAWEAVRSALGNAVEIVQVDIRWGVLEMDMP
jgi:putative IMPACT (imprinted ancient) family translation regulator